ncbi:hypothetical protein ACFQZ4_26295 [Catellatospora coxensis]|uniref:Uncharacterized protein n=1 Tax=Catellatospora coxensis TaxID=310354 RepID=A0A8J3L8J5_9ACTN|nr:hypothetical protein [Catellatospora coxensis]GIG09940.1 hypothetical protein Cco03nite_66400 [Catellatospora coxensis]
MPEHEHDDVLWSAVDTYRADTDPLIRPTGTAAAYATVRHRKRLRSTGVAASALVAVLAGGVAISALGGSGPTPPSPGGSTSAPPAASPSRTPSPVPVATGGSLHGLAGAVLDLPTRKVLDKNCPAGPTSFRDGKAGTDVWIDSAVETDLDADGRMEQVALIYCRPGEIPLGQVVAFRRDGEGFATLGVVVQVETPLALPPQQTPGTVERITKLAGDSSGEIRVEVGNLETTYSDLSGGPIGLYQWRSYRWNGSAFAQSGGSSSFMADTDVVPLDVVLSSPDLSPAPGGGTQVEVKVRVERVASAQAPVTVLVSVANASGVTVVGEAAGEPRVAGQTCAEGTRQWVRCQADRDHAHAFLTFHLTVPAGMTISELRRDLGDSWIYVRVGDQELERLSAPL